MSYLKSSPVNVSRLRYRGLYQEDNIFLLRMEEMVLRLWIIPRQQEELAVYNMQRGCFCGNHPILVTGIINKSVFNFANLLHFPEAHIPEMIRRAFNTSLENELALVQFTNAEVLLFGEKTTWGTVGQIVGHSLH